MGWRKRLSEKIRPEDRKVWIHCSSLGEFEQGRTLMEAIRSEHPELKIVLTFFSPSGYENRKDYPDADVVAYLPADLGRNARDFISLVNPELVIFVKYEYWSNYISELYRRDIPLYVVSAIFRPGQHFFRWYGRYFRNMLRKIRTIFVQDQRSADLLQGIGLRNAVISGDTRFDRVAAIVNSAMDIPQLEEFAGGEKIFLAGSSWSRDEEIIVQYIRKNPGRMKWVFAPHEIHRSNIDRLERLIGEKVVRYSEFGQGAADARVLIIDNIGMLSSAYRYAYIAEVGGGFGSGIHNILEPACWGIPVLFGPEYKDYKEAVDLLEEKGAMSFLSFSDFAKILDKLLTDEDFYRKCASVAGNYIIKNTGATTRVLKEIFG